MIINESQLQLLNDVIVSSGLSLSDFDLLDDGRQFQYSHKIEPSYRILIRPSINNATIGDVFCEPYTFQDTIYHSCNTFEECLSIVKEWAMVTKYRIAGKRYYHKVFISHSSNDKKLLDEFVDKILKQACGLSNENIAYTSIHSTGVNLGDGIPRFIKDNLKTSSLVLFMISDNYRKSEVCLNEMGAAWAFERKTLSILLPNMQFDKLGWLTSFNKAIKIDDEEGLDTLFDMLSRDQCELSDWTRIKKSFIDLCKDAKTISSTY